MSTINNLKVNRRAIDRIHKRSNGKKRFLKLVATAVVITIVAGAAVFGVNKIVDNINENQIQVITQYYGEDSPEREIIDYIGVSEKLQALNFDKYNVDDNLYSKYIRNNDLLEPSTLNDMIAEFKRTPDSISSKDLNKQDTNIFLTLLLMSQEKLVNQYIYEKGYSVANKNITAATKKYTAETFGVEDYKDIKLIYYNTGSGDQTLKIINQKDSFDEENYIVDGFFNTKEENKIIDGVIGMINTDTKNDHDDTDNYEYNRKRNIYIKNALEKSIELEKQVADNDLYNSKLAGKLK